MKIKNNGRTSFTKSLLIALFDIIKYTAKQISRMIVFISPEKNIKPVKSKQYNDIYICLENIIYII